MYYSININQIAIARYNKKYDTNFDLVDGAILEYLQKQSTSAFAKRNYKIFDGLVFYLLFYDNIIHQLPLIKIENKESIGRRIKKLVDANVILQKIEKIPNNGTKIYFTTTEIFETFFSYDTTQKSDGDTTQKSDGDTTQKSDELIYDKNINDKNKKDKDTASGFSQSENPVVKESLTTQNPTVKESLKVQKQKKEIQITKKDDIENFVRTFKANEFEVDGVIQFQSVFSENEIELITGYLLRRKEKHKSKAECSQRAIKSILNKILEIKGIHALEVVFEQCDGCYVNCGTAGDPTTPWIKLELEYFTKLIKKSTFNNQYAKAKPDYLEVQKRYAATGELQLSTTYRKRRD